MNETRKKSYRRTRAKRVKRYTYLSILLSALCLGGITYSKLTVEATQKKAQEPYKYYTEIRVQRGDTFMGYRKQIYGFQSLSFSLTTIWMRSGRSIRSIITAFIMVSS